MEQYQKIYLYKRIVQAKLYIDAHYAEPIDLSNIAEEAWFSKFHFIRLFKSIYGRTPHHYLTQVRIEKAKLLLQEGRSITEVSWALGFESPTSFAGLFKRHVGMAPSVFRRRQQQRQAEMAANPLRFVPNCFAENNGWVKNSNFEEAAF